MSRPEVVYEYGGDEDAQPEPAATGPAVETGLAHFKGLAFDHRIGALAHQSTEFALTGHKHRAFETPAAKLKRLTGEVTEFKEQMAALADAESLISKDEHAGVMAELQALEKTLATLPAPAERRSTGQAATLAQLLRRLEVRPKQGQGGPIAYDLFYAPATNGSSVDTAIPALEARVAQLEQALGAPSKPAPFVTMQAGLEAIEKELQTFDEEKIERVGRRIKDLTAELDGLLKKKEEIAAESDGKVTELYHLCHRWEAAAAGLPHVLQRLRTLKGIHEQSATFAARLAYVEQQQKELRDYLVQCTVALAKLQESMVENVKTIQSNMEHLEHTMSKK